MGGSGSDRQRKRERVRELERESQRRDAEALVSTEAGFELAGAGAREGVGDGDGPLELRPAGAWASEAAALDVRHLPSLRPDAARRLSSAVGTAVCAHESASVSVTGRGASVRVEHAQPPARPGAHAGALRASPAGAWLPCLVQAQPPTGSSLEAILFDPDSGAPLSGERLTSAIRGSGGVRVVLTFFLGPPVKLVETGPWLRDRLHVLAGAAAARALDSMPPGPRPRL